MRLPSAVLATIAPPLRARASPTVASSVPVTSSAPVAPVSVAVSTLVSPPVARVTVRVVALALLALLLAPLLPLLRVTAALTLRHRRQRRRAARSAARRGRPRPKLCTRDVSCEYATAPWVGVGESPSSLQTLRTITQNMDSAAAAVSPGSSTEDLRGHLQRTTRKEARRRRAATTWTAVPAGERTRSLADGPAGCRRRPALLSS
jgi:hypothetical protein